MPNRTRAPRTVVEFAEHVRQRLIKAEPSHQVEMADLICYETENNDSRLFHARIYERVVIHYLSGARELELWAWKDHGTWKLADRMTHRMHVFCGIEPYNDSKGRRIPYSSHPQDCQICWPKKGN